MLDEADLRASDLQAEVVRFLNSRADGVPITRYNTEAGRNDWFYSFGMTVMAMRLPPRDNGLNSRCLVYQTQATDRPEDYDLIPPEEWVAWGRRLQNKLLLFRFHQLAKLRAGELQMPSQLEIPGVSSFRVRESMLALSALSQEEPSILEDIRAIGVRLQRREIEDAANSIEGLVLNTLYGWLEPGDEDLSGEVEYVETTGYQNGWRLDFIREEVVHGSDTRSRHVPVILRNVATPLGVTSSTVADFWRGMGQAVMSQTRVEGRKYRGILIVRDPRRLDREFSRFVLDARPQAGKFRRAVEPPGGPPPGGAG